MKKFLLFSIAFILPFIASADWSKNDRKAYHNMMFQAAMQFQTYDNILGVKDTIEVIECIGTYYEDFYTFKEFEFLFHTGNENTIDEFTIVSDLCVDLQLSQTENNTNNIL